MLEKKRKQNRRHNKVRAKISGTAARPRLCIFRSSKHIYAQIINDEKGETIESASSNGIKSSQKAGKENQYTGKQHVSYELGKLIAKKALMKKIEEIVFDRGGYRYHGRVKAVAEGARKGGLKF